METIVGNEKQAGAYGKKGAGIGTIGTGPDVTHRNGIKAGIKAEKLTADAGPLGSEIEHASGHHQLLGTRGAAAGIDINQYGLGRAIGNPIELIALLECGGIGSEEELATEITDAIHILQTSHLADGPCAGIKGVKRPVGASIVEIRGSEVEPPIGIHQAVDIISIAPGEPGHHQELHLAGRGIELIKTATIHAVIGRTVIGGEIELAVHIGEQLGRRRQGAAVDVCRKAGAYGGAVALPELTAIHAIVVAEVEGAANGEQIAHRVFVGRGGWQQGPHRAVQFSGIEPPEIPLIRDTVNTEKSAERSAASRAATAPEAGIGTGIAQQQLARIGHWADLQIADAVAFIIDRLV